MLPTINPTRTNSWEKLTAHFKKMSSTHMKDLFVADTNRFDEFSVKFEDILLDYSKNIITMIHENY